MKIQKALSLGEGLGEALVNEEKPAGSYEDESSVGQDSSPDIASGIYFINCRRAITIKKKWF